MPPREGRCDDDARPLRHDRGVSNTDNTHTERKGKPDAKRDVDGIDQNGNNHRDYGILHTRKPTVKAKE